MELFTLIVKSLSPSLDVALTWGWALSPSPSPPPPLSTDNLIASWRVSMSQVSSRVVSVLIQEEGWEALQKLSSETHNSKAKVIWKSFELDTNESQACHFYCLSVWSPFCTFPVYTCTVNWFGFSNTNCHFQDVQIWKRNNNIICHFEFIISEFDVKSNAIF